MRYLLALLVTCLLTAPAVADVRYKVKSTHLVKEPGSAPACSKSIVQRMLKTTHIVAKGKEFRVNQVPYDDWSGDSELPGWATIFYIGETTEYFLHLYANDRAILGTWTVTDYNGKRACSSTVAIRGVRL